MGMPAGLMTNVPGETGMLVSIPAIADFDTKDVFTRLNQLRNVMDAIQDGFLVIGPAGFKPAIPDASTIQPYIVISQAAYV